MLITLNPETNSLSPSEKSKGLTFKTFSLILISISSPIGKIQPHRLALTYFDSDWLSFGGAKLPRIISKCFILLIPGGSSRRGSIVEGSASAPGSSGAAESARAFSYWLHVKVNPEVRSVLIFFVDIN